MAERHGTNSKHPRRRLAARRPVAAYGRTVQRCLLLILIASAPFLIGERPQSWDVLAGAGALAHVAAFLKFDAWSIFAIIGITSPWILPMVGRSARAATPNPTMINPFDVLAERLISKKSRGDGI
jgi:hypothetical protein